MGSWHARIRHAQAHRMIVKSITWISQETSKEGCCSIYFFPNFGAPLKLFRYVTDLTLEQGTSWIVSFSESQASFCISIEPGHRLPENCSQNSVEETRRAAHPSNSVCQNHQGQAKPQQFMLLLGYLGLFTLHCSLCLSNSLDETKIAFPFKESSRNLCLPFCAPTHLLHCTLLGSVCQPVPSLVGVDVLLLAVS